MKHRLKRFLERRRYGLILTAGFMTVLVGFPLMVMQGALSKCPLFVGGTLVIYGFAGMAGRAMQAFGERPRMRSVVAAAIFYLLCLIASGALVLVPAQMILDLRS